MTTTGSVLDWYLALPPQEVALDGTPLRYRDVGRGPPLVFVHGWPLCGTSWRHVVHALSSEFRCIVVDLPGAGDSPFRLHHPEYFRHIGRTLDLFCQALALHGYGLVGFDSGAAGCRYHAADNDAVKALLLSNTEVPGHAPTLVRRLQMLAGFPLSTLSFKLLLRSKRFQRSKFGFGPVFADRSFLDGEFADATFEPLLANVSGALAQLRCADVMNVGETLQRDVHPRLRMPVQLVWGGADVYFPVEGAQRCCEAIEDAVLHVVDDAGLLVHEERFEAYLDLTRRFFREHLVPKSAGGTTRPIAAEEPRTRHGANA